MHYAVLADEFVGMFVQPVWEAFVRAAHLSGVVRCPKEVPLESSDDALFVGQSMPWIDPYKETMAMEKQVQAGFSSEVEVIRKRGQNPRDVMDEQSSGAKRPSGVAWCSPAMPPPRSRAQGAAAASPEADTGKTDAAPAARCRK